MKKDNDILLQVLARHTNLPMPYSDYVKGDTFPEQITELLNTKVTIKYRNYYSGDLEMLLSKPALIIRNGVEVTSRPSDDYQFLTPRPITGPDDLDYDYVETGLFLVVRADKAEPYTFIGVSEDFQVVVIGSTKTNDMGHYCFIDDVLEYPYQFLEYVAVEVNDRYAGDINLINGITYRVDKGEPCKSIIMELLDDNVVRFVLGDEVLAIPPKNIEPGEIELTNAEIASARKVAIEGKTIYGTV